MKTYLLLHWCFYLCSCVDIIHNDVAFELKSRSSFSEAISGTLQRIVKTYHCAAEDIKDQQIILYGTKAWTFPIQSVNLTLRYPSTYPDSFEFETEGYVITGLLVVLHMDGPESRGYVTQGGILMDNISMTFVIRNISRLSYQFWLYGVRNSHVDVSDYILTQNLC